MNQDEWSAGLDTLKMLEHLGDSSSGRKLRLFAAACARDDLASDIPEKELSAGDLKFYEQEITSSEIIADGGQADSGIFFINFNNAMNQGGEVCGFN